MDDKIDEEFNLVDETTLFNGLEQKDIDYLRSQYNKNKFILKRDWIGDWSFYDTNEKICYILLSILKLILSIICLYNFLNARY